MNGKKEKEYACWLSRVSQIGAVTAKKLLDAAGSFEGIYHMEGKELREKGLLRERAAEAFSRQKEDIKKSRELLLKAEEKGIRMVLWGEEAYPERLTHLYDAPMWLYVKGSLPREDAPSAAIIGARTCTAYGRQEAEYTGHLLADAGVSVISGMAMGIDGAGQRGALENGGRTYGILGCGADICYPKVNRSLYEAIPARGGLISEYPPGTGPTASHFPVRNRIISGLSDLVIVVEAREKSGSLITADAALEQGKDVAAFPGRRTDELSAGCNRLIRQGAAIVTEPQDILDFFALNWKSSCQNPDKSENALAKTEKMVYSCLDSHPRHVEEVMRQSGLAAGDCLEALLTLELAGLVLQPANQYYIRKLK